MCIIMSSIVLFSAISAASASPSAPTEFCILYAHMIEDYMTLLVLL